MKILNNSNKLIAVLMAAAVTSTFAITPLVLADETKHATAPAASENGDDKKDMKQQETQKKAIAKQEKKQNELLEKINKDVLDGFKKVADATKLINDGKEKDAIDVLEAATGKFDIALAANPDLGLIPIAASVDVIALITLPETVKAQVELAKDYLSDSRVQVARAILAPLTDEIVTSTSYLPMSTYPDAIKLATKELVAGNQQAASEVLATALSTIVINRSVIPLSLVRAESMIKAASETDKENDKAMAMSLLDDAKQQLKLATALGYTDKHSSVYKDISAQIKALKKEAKGKNKVEKLYVKLQESVKGLLGKHSELEEVKSNEKK